MLTACLLALALSGGPPEGVVVPSAAAPTYLLPGGKGSARLLLNEASGSREAALDLLVLAPGAEVPEHAHEKSAELLYVEEGQLEMVIGGKALKAGPGDAIYIPANVKHRARVVGKVQGARAVQVYVGPGPEQRFAKGEKIEGE